MKTNFKFSNLCGSVYKAGNIVFTPDGNSIVSPVGNRISIFDLVNNRAETLPTQSAHDIEAMAISPNGLFIVAIDRGGMVNVINTVRKITIAKFGIQAGSTTMAFSPDSRLFAISSGSIVYVYSTPNLDRQRSKLETFAVTGPAKDDISHVSWTSDNRGLLVSSRDRLVRLHVLPAKIQPRKYMQSYSLGGHQEAVVAAWLGPDDRYLYTVTRNRAFVVRRCVKPDTEDEMTASEFLTSEGQGLWEIVSQKALAKAQGGVTCAAFHAASQLLVLGFGNGSFGIWQMPDATPIHLLSVGSHPITTITLNPTGEWIGVGSAALGQLLVWEWQSESYVLKQQGHSHDMSAVAYSPDGQYVATGDGQGRIKVWNTGSGYCFVTFTDHKGAIEALTFTKNGQVVVSASLDGTVRAFDLIRYRNFRTLVSPTPTQFGALAVDPSGEIVTASAKEDFTIFSWSLQTGKLLDTLAAHQAPVSQLAFHPEGNILASASWDKTVRLWYLLDRDRKVRCFEHSREVLSVAFRPDGEQLACSTLDGQINFWNVEYGTQTGSIEGRRDLVAGKAVDDLTSINNQHKTQAFTRIAYSADGTAILGGGRSNHICLYDTDTYILIRRFRITENLDYQGVKLRANYRQQSDGGPLALIDDQSDEEVDLRGLRVNRTSLPGVRKGDLSQRTTQPEIRTTDLAFSPTGRAWAAVCTDGLLLYSLDEAWIFDPFDLDTTVTPAAALAALRDTDYLMALIMALRLNEATLIAKIYDAIPSAHVPVLVPGFPGPYVGHMLNFIATQAERSPHLEFHLLWVAQLMKHHGDFIRRQSNRLQPTLRNIQKVLSRMQVELAKVCTENVHTIRYLKSLSRRALEDAEKKGSEDEDEEESDDSEEDMDEESSSMSVDNEEEEEDLAVKVSRSHTAAKV
ncbi:U3 snoRNP protein [Tieghemiomyces parasiticus]|uniref:U3 snoRNP protein n=1 Tax=Tieghemiomyces parasiticus TaxID=78921 RepID=A0A9W8AHC6_9FUNG|nr:U3 snoRNP protein [Tieghemiomyces parasiticus]